jgi:UDP-3-O-[3-hydroxymyristoyl] glucosamine N-acyltransferase
MTSEFAPAEFAALPEAGESIVGDPQFFRRTGPHSLAAVVDAAMAEAPPRRLMFRGVAPLAVAAAADVSFLDSGKYLGALTKTRAGAVIVHPDLAGKVPASAVPILSTEVHAAWARVAALFHPPPPAVPGVHPSAVVGANTRIHPSAEIGPLAFIGDGASIGARTRIAPLAAIGAGVEIGTDCRIGSHASISHARLGDRVYVYPGARIGQEGFGFTITPEGFLTAPQLGRAILHDDVEIGANTTVDRGGLTDTVIGAGTRIDNLVQIAHGVQLGRCCVMAGQSGIAGSTIVEDFVLIGGQVAVAGHLVIGRGAKLAARTGVMQDVAAGAELGGTPAQPVRAWMREVAWLRRVTRSHGWGKTGSGKTPAEETAKETATETE